jgi:hypothetical protein
MPAEAGTCRFTLDNARASMSAARIGLFVIGLITAVSSSAEEPAPSATALVKAAIEYWRDV